MKGKQAVCSFVEGGQLRERQDLTDEIAKLAALPDHSVGLADAALTIARFEYPDLEASLYVEQLNDMAAKLRSRIEEVLSPQRQIDEMNRLLFQEERFQGNRSHYYDPRNSFLNQVLDRRLGIPITLSIVYIEVGRRAELPFYGIGFPGHFLVGLLTEGSRMFIDPFNNGRVLSENDCRSMLRGQAGVSRTFSRSVLDPAWPKQILVRLLRNLKALYLDLSEQIKALRMIEWILILDRHSAPELRDRGFLYEAIGDAQGAIKDLERYLELAPRAEDEEHVKATIERLKRTKSTVH
jgi:regulator of sirC expression with transglutaminase-like and TPR domain